MSQAMQSTRRQHSFLHVFGGSIAVLAASTAAPAAPEVVYEGNTPTSIALNTTHVFLALTGHSLETCGLAPEDVPILVKLSLDLSEFQVLLSRCAGGISLIRADESHLYYKDSDQTVKRVAVDGSSNPELLIDENGEVGHVVADSQLFYWADNGNPADTLYTTPLAGGVKQALATVQNGSEGIRAIVLDNDHVYWTEGTIGSGRIRRVAKVGGPVTVLADEGDGIDNPGGLAVDGTHLYFSQATSPSVRRLPKAGGQVSTYLTDGLPNYRAFDIALSPVQVFWTDGTGGYDGRLRRLDKSSAPVADAEVANLSILALLAGAIVTNDTHVYWTEIGAAKRSAFDAEGVAVDLSVREIEVTQGIQRLPDGGVIDSAPLVEDKLTYVRVYPGVRFPGADFAPNVHQQNVRLELRGSRNGEDLPGSPLKPLEDGLTVREQGDYRRDWHKTFNFKLPLSWRSGQVRLSAEVNPSKEIAETDYANNVWEHDYTFRSPQSLCPVFVPILADGPFAPRVTDDDMAEIIDLARTLWPSGRFHLGYYESIQEGAGHYEMPDDGDKVLSKLQWINFFAQFPFSWCEAGSGSIHFVGVVDPPFNFSGTVGSSRNGSNASWFMKFNAQSSSIPDTLLAMYKDLYGEILVPPVYPFGAHVFAHELAHNFGRDHIDCPASEPEGVDSSYPYDADRMSDESERGYWGFEPRRVGKAFLEAWTIIPPEVQFKDLMSYCHPKWTSDYTYRFVLDAHGSLAGIGGAETNGHGGGQADPPLSPTDDILFFSASVNETDDSAEIDRVAVVPGSLFTQAKLGELDAARRRLAPSGLPGMADYHLKSLDLDSSELASFAIAPPRAADSLNDSRSFILPVRFEPGARRLELLRGTKTIASHSVSSSPPSVRVLAPNGGEVFAGGFTIRWLSEDAENGALTHDVFYSPDNGASWQVLALEVEGDTYSVQSPELLPGSPGKALVRVMVNDGTLTGRDASDRPFTVDWRLPRPGILDPDAGEALTHGHGAVLRGWAPDAEDGEVVGSGLSWTVDGTPLGSGGEVVASGLSPGKHTAVLVATDSHGRTATDAVDFYVLPRYCPLANRNLQVVFLLESSSLAVAQGPQVCARIEEVVALLKSFGLEVRHEVVGVQLELNCEARVVAEIDPNTTVADPTHWPQGVESLAERYPWRDAFTRLIVPIVLQPPATGRGETPEGLIDRAVRSCLEAGVSVSPWLLPLGAQAHPTTAALARELAGRTGGTVSIWPKAAEDLAISAHDAKARSGCRPIVNGVQPDSRVVDASTIVIFGENLRPGIRVCVDGQPVRDLTTSADGSWASFGIPLDLGAGNKYELKVDRPGGGSAVLPDRIETSSVTEPRVNRGLMDLRFNEGSEVEPRGIEFQWFVMARLPPLAFVNASSEIRVDVNGMRIGSLFKSVQHQATPVSCEYGGTVCDGSCMAKWSCSFGTVSCGCNTFTPAGVDHDLQPGDRVRVEILAVPGSQPDADLEDNVLEAVFGGSGGGFIRGDCNADGAVTGTVADAVFLLSYNFLGGKAPSCLAACDVNGDGSVVGNVADAVYVLQFNFLGGPAPPAPFPDCGTGTPPDAALGCTTYSPCQ